MKTKIFVIVTILTALIVQNLCAQEMRKQRDGSECKKFQSLNLTEEQQEQITTLKLNHQMQMIDLKANLEKKKLGLAELKNNGNYTREEFVNKVEEIDAAKNEIAISRANHQMDVYELLDTNQKKEWNKITLKCGDRKEKRVMKKQRNKN